MSVLLSLLLLLLTEVIECSSLRTIERCLRARSRSWSGGGRWVLLKERRNHVLTLAIMNLATASRTTNSKHIKHITTAFLASAEKRGPSHRTTERVTLAEDGRCARRFQARRRALHRRAIELVSLSVTSGWHH